MSAPVPLHSSGALGETIDQCLESCERELKQWKSQHDGNTLPLGMPDVGPTCEVILADALFHDLSDEEKERLGAWLRSEQQANGAWLDVQGRPDLSLTALGWWARRQLGDPAEDDSMQTAIRFVHEQGGAQRSSLSVRLWLALAGTVPWTWIPAIPGELWLLPPNFSISPFRLSTWARSVMMAVHVLAQAPARLQLSDASALLLQSEAKHANKSDVLLPRLARPGLGGDFLQLCDRAIRLSRKVPRGPLAKRVNQHLQHSINQSQQEHGGWFSVRPTIYSLLALRTLGVGSDDHRIKRGLRYLRQSRSSALRPSASLEDHDFTNNNGALVQCLNRDFFALELQVDNRTDLVGQLVSNELAQAGPWQRRADCAVGGWPIEKMADEHLDTWATAASLEAINTLLNDSKEQGLASSKHIENAQPALWAASRRAGEVLLAMQENDGSFARFERGETTVPLAHLPWKEAKNLALCDANDSARIFLSAFCLRQLKALGWHLNNDRITAGLAWLEKQFRHDGQTWDIRTLAEVTRTAASYGPANGPFQNATEALLRKRQREDGRFGDLSDTAAALLALLQIDPDCIQSHRAAQALMSDVMEKRFTSKVIIAGLGLSPHLLDLSAPVRMARDALLRYRQLVLK